MSTLEVALLVGWAALALGFATGGMWASRPWEDEDDHR
jgi:hypothetical protein